MLRSSGDQWVLAKRTADAKFLHWQH